MFMCALPYFWCRCVRILKGLPQLLLLDKDVLQVLIHLQRGKKERRLSATDRRMDKGQTSDSTLCGSRMVRLCSGSGGT